MPGEQKIKYIGTLQMLQLPVRAISQILKFKIIQRGEKIVLGINAIWITRQQNVNLCKNISG